MSFFSKVFFFLRAIRAGEVILMIGFGLIGAFYALPDLEWGTIQNLGIYAAGVFCLFLSIYLLNSAWGYAEDLQNPRFKNFLRVPTYRVLALFTFCGTFLFLFLSFRIWLMGVLSYLLWVVYSWPRVGFKYRAYRPTLLHWVSGIIFFNMGYAVFQAIHLESLALGIYFGLLFAAGHLYHEVIDFEADRNQNLKTLAVKRGPETSLFLSSLLFGLAPVWLFLMGLSLPHVWTLVWPFLGAFLLHLGIYSISRIHSGWKPVYHQVYRLLYLMAGALLLGFKILKF